MLTTSTDTVLPTDEGMASLEKSGLLSPSEALRMRAAAALQAKLPANYTVMSISEGADHPWARIVARWDGKAMTGDVSAELASAVAPMEVHYAGMSNGMFSWDVDASMPSEEPAAPERVAPEGTLVTFTPPAKTA